MIRIAYESEQIDRLEMFLFLDLLAGNLLHDRRIVHGNDFEIDAARILGAFRIRHRKDDRTLAVPILVRNVQVSDALVVYRYGRSFSTLDSSTFGASFCFDFLPFFAFAFAGAGADAFFTTAVQVSWLFRWSASWT